MNIVLSVGRIARAIGVAVVPALAPLPAATGIPNASAEPCPDVEVVFARGTGEPPGVGGGGQAFVDSVREQLGGKSVGVYAGNYLASGDFADPIRVPNTVIHEIRHEHKHPQT